MRKPPLAEKETLTTEEAIRLFGLSRRKFRNLIEENRLPFMAAYKDRRLVIRDELAEYLKNNPEVKEALKNGASRKTANKA